MSKSTVASPLPLVDLARVSLAPPRTLNIVERKLALRLGDLCGLLLATALAWGLYGPGLAEIAPDQGTLLLRIATLVILWSITAHTFDCYELAASAQPGKSAQRIGLAVAVTLGIYSFIPFASPPYFYLGRAVLAANLVAALGSLVAWRVASAALLARQSFRARAVIIGRGQAGPALAKLLGNGAGHGYEVVEVINPLPGADTRDLSDRLRALVDEQGVSEIIVGAPAAYSPEFQTMLVELAERGASVVDAATVYESLAGKVLLPLADSAWLAALLPRPRLYPSLRRIIDTVIAAAALMVASPFVAVAAALIVLGSPGPCFYWQYRVGQYGRVFRLAKLRTMVQDAEPDGGAIWAQQGDPRVTRVGRFLRRSRLDEVPQLWNVLRGEMSLIGPRPERPEFVHILSHEFPMYGVRHIVAPGITGWAQVNFGYGSTIDHAETKLEYDLFYVRHRSPLIDAMVLLRTISVVLRFAGT